jgi:hypothetical protein
MQTDEDDSNRTASASARGFMLDLLKCVIRLTTMYRAVYILYGQRAAT